MPWAAPSASPDLDARQTLGHEREAFGDDLPVVGGVAGHEVEGHAHRLHRAAEHAEVAETLTGVVLRDRELEPFAHHLGGDAVGVGHRVGVDGGEGPQAGAVVLGAFGGAVGGEVGHLVVVAGDALTGGGERVERGEPLDVVVGQSVDGRELMTRPPGSPSGR